MEPGAELVRHLHLLVGDEIVIVEPDTMRIVAVIA